MSFRVVVCRLVCCWYPSTMDSQINIDLHVFSSDEQKNTKNLSRSCKYIFVRFRTVLFLFFFGGVGFQTNGCFSFSSQQSQNMQTVWWGVLARVLLQFDAVPFVGLPIDTLMNAAELVHLTPRKRITYGFNFHQCSLLLSIQLVFSPQIKDGHTTKFFSAIVDDALQLLREDIIPRLQWHSCNFVQKSERTHASWTLKMQVSSKAEWLLCENWSPWRNFQNFAIQFLMFLEGLIQFHEQHKKIWFLVLVDGETTSSSTLCNWMPTEETRVSWPKLNCSAPVFYDVFGCQLRKQDSDSWPKLPCL